MRKMINVETVFTILFGFLFLLVNFLTQFFGLEKQLKRVRVKVIDNVIEDYFLFVVVVVIKMVLNCFSKLQIKSIHQIAP